MLHGGDMGATGTPRVQLHSPFRNSRTLNYSLLLETKSMSSVVAQQRIAAPAGPNARAPRVAAFSASAAPGCTRVSSSCSTSALSSSRRAAGQQRQQQCSVSRPSGRFPRTVCGAGEPGSMSMGDSLKEMAALDELIDALLSAKSQQQVRKARRVGQALSWWGLGLPACARVRS